MIGAVRTWLTTLVAVSLLLSVVQTLVPEGRLRRIASFTGGLLLMLTLLRPLLGADLERLDLHLEDYEAEIAARQAELAESGRDQLQSIIETRTAAYISDKADALGLNVTVRVEAKAGEDGVPVPCRADLAGERSEALASYMEESLGIPRERQVWRDEEE